MITLFETYSKIHQEVLEFITDLPDWIVLYRTLVFEEWMDLDKVDLGVSWTLDKEFAENITKHKSWQHADPETQYLKIITIKVPKKYIDIEETVKVRSYVEHSFENEIVLKSSPHLQNYITHIQDIDIE